MTRSGIQVTHDIRDRFFALLESLSALRSLANLGQGVESEADLAYQALVQLVKHQNLAFCSIFFLEDDLLRCVAGTGFDEEHAKLSGQVQVSLAPDKSMHFSMDEGVIGLACQTGQLQYCRDCSTDERFKPFDYPAQQSVPGSLVVVPLQFGGEMMGVLNVSHPVPENFEPWQQHMLSLYGSVLAQMLHSYRLMNSLDTLVKQRTQQLQEALSESEAMREQYKRLSMIDGLTGLFNRRYFFPEAESQLSRSIRYEQPFSLLLLDIDFFKQINDRWGHQVGDNVLKSIASELQRISRQGDVVARLGGEEFIVVLPNTDIDGADQIAERIQAQVAQLEFEREGPKGITLCIGMTSLNDRSINHMELSRCVDILCKEADMAMYECKRRGRNQRLVFDENEICLLGSSIGP
ncbi:MAG: sensor domain-containing diguanylate cyclase [Candidatus Polarisedimenticolaceae bacterium]|nr:sensor domain-containing diguanylate cyclase [Candidatus Polarisedimenticolaceae bacterium]